MQKISLCDDITIKISAGASDINITCSNLSENIPADNTNTAYKAAESFFLRAGVNGVDLDIAIKKNIPAQSGLGGGSSDAAAVLLGLNEYFGHILPENVLLEIAAAIGADVPFFVKNVNCAACGGIGEIVTPVETDLPGPYCLIAKPAYNISTKQAYEDFDRYNNSAQPRPPSGIYNDFEGLIFSRNGDMEKIKSIILKYGAKAAGLSGSGPALFGIFGVLSGAQRCAGALKLMDGVEFCDIFDFLY